MQVDPSTLPDGYELNSHNGLIYGHDGIAYTAQMWQDLLDKQERKAAEAYAKQAAAAEKEAAAQARAIAKQQQGRALRAEFAARSDNEHKQAEALKQEAADDRDNRILAAKVEIEQAWVEYRARIGEIKTNLSDANRRIWRELASSTIEE